MGKGFSIVSIPQGRQLSPVISTKEMFNFLIITMESSIFFFINNKPWINVSHFRGDSTLIQNTRPLTFSTTHTPPTPKYLKKFEKNRLQPSLLYPNKPSKHHLHTDQRINTPIREGKDCILRLGSNPSSCL